MVKRSLILEGLPGCVEISRDLVNRSLIVALPGSPKISGDLVYRSLIEAMLRGLVESSC